MGKTVTVNRATKQIVYVTTVLTIICFISSLILPIVFEGMPVYIPREGLGSQAAPLKWTFSNFGQSVYITLNLIFIVYALQTKKLSTNIFLYSFSVAMSIFIWQGLARYYGIIPFPYEFFFGVEHRSLAYGQTIMGIPRLNGSFGEPSNAGSYFSMAFAYFLAWFMINRKPIIFCGALLSGLAVMGTTSTTGIATAAIVLGAWLIILVSNFIVGKRVSKISLFIAQCVPLLIFSVCIAFWRVIDRVIFNKSDTSSFLARGDSNWHAFDVLIQTGGLGVGLGSNRPSSFLLFLLSNIGIIGTLIFVVMIFLIVRYAFMTKKVPLAAALVTYLISKIIAQPDMSDPMLWTLITLIVAGELPVDGRRKTTVTAKELMVTN
ncbi:MAG: hypothetical protein AAF704_06960 [Cyanobacteria bacterium P01_D01_bin.123]